MEGFRLEGQLREFPKFKPREMWFRFPLHVEDRWQLLADAKAAGEEPPWMAAQREKEKSAKEHKNARDESFEAAIMAAGGSGSALHAVGELMTPQANPRTVRRRVDKSKKWIIMDGKIVLKTKPKTQEIDI